MNIILIYHGYISRALTVIHQLLYQKKLPEVDFRLKDLKFTSKLLYLYIPW